jgi:GntR family transcriptional regulator
MQGKQGRPAYRQIAEDLSAQIEDGSLPEGARIPSEAELREDYGVSRIVVRQAMELLASQGLISKERGRGSFVRPRGPKETRIVGDFYGKRHTGSPFAAAVKAAGHRPEWDYQTRETTASPAVAERLGIQAGDPVMRTTYTFFSDDQPVMLSTSYEPLAITRGTPVEHPEAGPVTGVVARMDSIGKVITHVTEETVARAARNMERESLDVADGTPVFAIARTYFAGDEAVETADIVVSADRYKLKYRVPLPPPSEQQGSE